MNKTTRPKIISFSGTDGSGKSSQVELLIKYFEENGMSYRVFYGRSERNIICRIIKWLASRWSGFKRLYLWTNNIVRIKLFCFDVRRKLNNQFLLMDRSIIDDIVDISFLTSVEPTIPKWSIKPDICVYIYADIESIRWRMENRGEKFDSYEVKSKQALYDMHYAGNRQNILRLDSGTMTEKQMFRNIIDAIENLN